MKKRIPRALAGLLAGLASLADPLHAESRAPQDVHVGVLMFDRVQIIDFAGPYEVFGQAGFKVSTVSAEGKPVTTHMGLKVTPDFALATAPAFDVVLVPGGHVHDVMHDKQVQAWLRARAAQAEHLLSVCTGSHILATSGLLENLTATTFHRAFDEMAQLSPSTRVVRDVRWVDNGRIVTAAGLSSGMDAALHLVERLQGRERARTIAMHLEYDWRPDEGFVRGLMADRYIPRVHVNWPEGMRAERLAAYGDRTQWLERYRVQGSAAPVAYLDAIERDYADLPNWTMKRIGPHELAFRGQPDRAVEADLRVSASAPAADGSFELTSRLQLER